MPRVTSDRRFWSEQRSALLAALRPFFEEAFWAGARAGALELPAVSTRADDPDIDLDPLAPWLDSISAAADEYIDAYTSDFWSRMEAGRRERLRAALQTAKAEGLNWRYVAKRIAQDYGPARAKAIAITEITNVMGAGAQATYTAAGFTQWQWRTVRDTRVDPICDARSDTTYPMSDPFAAAHVACRCWPVPYGPPTPPELSGYLQ